MTSAWRIYRRVAIGDAVLVDDHETVVGVESAGHAYRVPVAAARASRPGAVHVDRALLAPELAAALPATATTRSRRAGRSSSPTS